MQRREGPLAQALRFVLGGDQAVGGGGALGIAEAEDLLDRKAGAAHGERAPERPPVARRALGKRDQMVGESVRLEGGGDRDPGEVRDTVAHTLEVSEPGEHAPGRRASPSSPTSASAAWTKSLVR